MCAAVAVMASASACTRPTVSGVYDRDQRAVIRLDDDHDADGRIDVRTYFHAGHAERLEADVNGDGQVDRWEYYDEAGRLVRLGRASAGDGREDTWVRQDGEVMRVDISTRRDGVIDRREVYQRDVLARIELDTDRDGLPDEWQQFEGGRLRELRVDSAHLGRPDRRLVYASNGSLERIEVDPDGDGRFVPQVPAEGTP